MGDFNRQYNVFVPVNFGQDNRMMFSIIPYPFPEILKEKLGESLSKSIMRTALRKANAVMHNAMKNSSHNGYVTNNINRQKEHHVKLGRLTYRRFRNNTPSEERSRKIHNARSLLNTRKKPNNFYTLGNYNTGVLVRYSINPRKRKVNNT